MSSNNPEHLDFFDELPEEIQNELEIAIPESYQESNLVSHEEAMREIEKCLQEEKQEE